ncbi:MAG: ABC transporter permease [Tannerella sp.]|jgi:putative ABC transport system permease protein|nr:ABC transporter permease [Tannerella sp.]
MMKSFYHSFTYLVRGKGNSLIKIASLTLGLAVALVLFSKVAHEMSYDTLFPDSERIYRIQRKIYADDRVDRETERLYAPVAGDLKADIEEIEASAAVMLSVGERYLQNGEVWTKERVLETEASFFDVFGIRLREGEGALLDVPSNLFLSASAAVRLFGNGAAVGKTLVDGSRTYTVAGVFEDMPASHLAFDVLAPLREHAGDLLAEGWRNPDAFGGYVRLRQGVAAETVEDKIKTVLPKYMDVAAMTAQGNVHEFYLAPVAAIHSGSADVRQLTVVLSLLAFALLFVAAMNYVLISVSSLTRRAKAVGIHKCSGASKGNIFRMFIGETAIVVFAALIVSVMLIFVCRGMIESMIQTPLSAVFSVRNLWVAGAVLAALLLLAGVMPAAIFAAVPVTHLFRAYSTDRRRWKHALLFVQFAGITYAATLLVIIVGQYNLLLYADLGYATENIIYTENIHQLTRDEVERVKAELERMPEVRSASVTSNLPTDRMNGILAKNGENMEVSFSSRSIGVDADFLETLQIRLLAGSNVEGSSNNYTRAVVNERFVEMMGWTDAPVGKTFYNGLTATPTEVIGVVGNFKTHTLYESEFNGNAAPVALFPIEKSADNWLFGWNRVILHLHSTDAAVMARLNEKLQQLTGHPTIGIVSYRALIRSLYHDTLLYRDTIVAAAVILLIIVILGLTGFTDDEISRRSKEIAIRKVFGASAGNILTTVARGIVLVSIPAILTGLMLSFVTGGDWLRQFAEKIPLGIPLFAASGLAVLAGIVSCIAIRAWTVANGNPVNYIRTE